MLHLLKTLLEDIIKSYGLNCAVYADNTQLYISIDKSVLQSGISNLQICIDAIPEWLADNELVCNKSKTDVIHLSSRFQQDDLLSEITIGNSNVVLASSVCDLGATLDCHECTCYEKLSKISSRTIYNRKSSRCNQFVWERSRTFYILSNFSNSKLCQTA